MIVDTHCHINTKAFDQDLNEVIKRAIELDVSKMIVVGMDSYHNDKTIELIETYDGLYGAIGIHPCDVEHADFNAIIPLLDHKKVVAVGETGIDLYWDKTNLDKQKAYFIKHIEISIKYNLPLIIHTRDSFNEAYEIIKPYKGKVKGVFHAFSSSLEDALKVIDLGLYIGIGGVVTFPKAETLKEIVKHISLDHMLLETDSPYLTPVPFRGKRNEPGYTKYVCEMVGKIKDVSSEVVAKTTSDNAHKLFGLEQKI